MKRITYFSIGFIVFCKLHLERYFPIGNWTPPLDTRKILFWPVGIVSPSPSVIFSYTSIFKVRCKIFPHSFSAAVDSCSLGILLVLLCHLWTDCFKILLNFKWQKKCAKQRKAVYNFSLDQCYAGVIKFRCWSRKPYPDVNLDRQTASMKFKDMGSLLTENLIKNKGFICLNFGISGVY